MYVLELLMINKNKFDFGFEGVVGVGEMVNLFGEVREKVEKKG